MSDGTYGRQNYYEDLCITLRAEIKKLKQQLAIMDDMATRRDELELENARLKAELDAMKSPRLAREQPCGCVVCRCDGPQCLGCGARTCGTHPMGYIPNPIYQDTENEWLTDENARLKAQIEKLRFLLTRMVNRLNTISDTSTWEDAWTREAERALADKDTCLFSERREDAK
jgi:regulator of replication initiation timing